jgi:hypothetical protein
MIRRNESEISQHARVGEETKWQLCTVRSARNLDTEQLTLIRVGHGNETIALSVQP